MSSPSREQLSIMAPHQYKQFNRDLVFVFNESEVATSINHFAGIAEKPNCVVEIGGSQFEHAPHLVYSLRLYEDAVDADFPYGQLLFDYGTSFLPRSEDSWSTHYDAERGPFADGSKALRSGVDSTLYVDYWDAVARQSLAAEGDVVVVSDDSGVDEGDEEEGDEKEGWSGFGMSEAQRWEEDPIGWMVCCECEISQELTNYLDEYLETNESAKVTKKLVRKWYTNHRKYADDDEWCDITKHLDFAVKWATRVVDKYHEEQEEEATTPGKRKTIGGKAPRSHNQPASDTKKDKSDRKKAEQTPNKKATIKKEPASAGKRGSAPRTNHAKKTPKKKTPQKTQEYYLNYTSSYSF